MKQVTISREQYRNVCDALINITNLNEQLLLLSTPDKKSESIRNQASEILKDIEQKLAQAVGEKA
ncbi:hypothetical protein AB6864_00780 [Serratia proteamaculans]|uniref:hypothetical protein n=1 Tax=Serratia proteamaculans TaxID=28151 RepID=UPI0028D2112D|nr:hypothetical protein [uncultured Serratia sp.]